VTHQSSETTQVLRVQRRSPGEAERRPQWFSLTQASAKRLLLVLVAAPIILMILTWAFTALSSFLFLLLLAWLLSIAMEPMVLWLGKVGVRRGLASALVLLGMAVVTLGLGFLFGGVFFSQAQQLKDDFPTAVSQAVAWINGRFQTSFNTDQIYSALQLTPERAAQLFERFGGGLLGAFGALMTGVFGLVTILVFAYYLSADSIRLRQTIGSFLPPRYQPVLMTVWTIAVEKTGGYVVSKLILAMVSSAFYAGFFLIINLDFWLPLGLLVGIIGQFVPIIGTYIGVAVPALFAVVKDPLDVVWIIIFATVYQQIESYWLTPKVSNRTMDVHPAVALGSVFVGVGLFGPIGALIGIPVAAAALTIMETFRRRHELLPELEALQEDEVDEDPDEQGLAPTPGGMPPSTGGA
jgi:predicted PurR-regulated permease PerM